MELREIILRDKPQAFLDTSPSATVPCLQTPNHIIDESLDIMIWALQQSDPEGLLNMPSDGHDLIGETDGGFKTALDRYKYPTRYDGVDTEAERGNAMAFLADLEPRLQAQTWLFGATPKLADLAILPFVRQYAHVDLSWWNAHAPPHVQRWLSDFKTSDRFLSIMQKYPAWADQEQSFAFP